MLGQPAERTGVGQAFHLDQVRIGLVAHLKRVPAVGEDDGAVLKHHGRPGGSRETGRPGQPVIAGRQVFVLILVLMRDIETIEALGLHGIAKLGKVVAAKLRAALHVEILSHVPKPSANGSKAEGGR